MRRYLSRFLVVLLAGVGLCACKSSVIVGELSLLSPDYHGGRIEVLARDVVGEDCLSGFESGFNADPSTVSYGRAVADALRKVPGANVMQDVTFELVEKPFALCARVKGDAGKFR